MPVSDEEVVQKLRELLKDVDMETTTGKFLGTLASCLSLCQVDRACVDLFRKEATAIAREPFQGGVDEQETCYQ